MDTRARIYTSYSTPAIVALNQSASAQALNTAQVTFLGAVQGIRDTDFV